MAKLVILNLDGSLTTGFRVSLELKLESESPYLKIASRLPSNPELSACLAKWQQQYYQLEYHYRIKPKKIIYNGSIDSRKQLAYYALSLQQQLQSWLESPDFKSIDRKLREELNCQEIIRMLICSDRPAIYQLPWYSWDLLASYPQLEIAFSNLNFEIPKSNIPLKLASKVKILAILGNSKGINLESDRIFLKSLTNANVVFLVEPLRQQLYDCLYQEAWDIIFFAGHSQTINSQGFLYLNQKDAIGIPELQHGFKQAIAAGLQLAIFNSCDGLGLAGELAKLSLPQCIVMRLPVPDRVAQRYLRYFLQAYTAGNPLYLANRMAREQLQGWEKEFPYASWLPIIYQNPAVKPPNWHDLYVRKPLTRLNSRSTTPRLVHFKLPKIVFLVAAIATGIIWLCQSWGWLQPGELKMYDRAMSWRNTYGTNERTVVVTVDDLDIKYQQQQKMVMQGSLSDEALLILLTKLQPHQPKAIASDIIHDFPFDPKLATLLKNTDNFLGICRIESNQSELIGIEPPSELSLDQVGFSNLAIDADGTIRRQILGMSPDRVCQSDFSFSLRLAFNYLDNIAAKFTDRGLQIGDVVFPQLQFNSGGYRLNNKEAKGYQILLDYHQQRSPNISLREILNIEEQKLTKLVKGKLVLIGGKGHNRDVHHTPYSRTQKTPPTPGVFIHAQMTNQILGAVLDGRKLLWWFPDWVELLWIALWSLVGSVAMAIWRIPELRAIAFALSLSLLFTGFFGLFFYGAWIVAIAPALALLLSALGMITYQYLYR